MPKTISTSQLSDLLYDENVRIIDIRPISAYNGWPMNGETYTGHIPGAKSLPFSWSSYMDWIEVVHAKGIDSRHTIVIYGEDLMKLQKVAALFEKAGYSDVYIYERFVSEWLVAKMPMERLQRYRNLVDAHWVKRVIDGDTPDDYTGTETIICHAHYRNREAYLSGHIPGAIDMDTLALEAPETWNRRSPDELRLALEQHGITTDTTVILYGKFMFPDNDDEFPGSAAGHIGAIRCAVIMLYAGVKDVRVLNGGFQSWKDAGYEISTNDVPKQPVFDFGCTVPARPEMIIDTPKAKEYLDANDAELVSVRSWPEFIGEVSGYNYIVKKGRIPGAVFGNCGTDAYHMENYRNVDHTTREAQEIEALWMDAHLSPEKRLAFYCGTGWRGSEAFFNAWLMGWPNIALYDGGWFEWSNDPSNPVEKGVLS